MKWPSIAVGLACLAVPGWARADLRVPEPDVTPPKVVIETPRMDELLFADVPVHIRVEAIDESGVAEVDVEVRMSEDHDLELENPPWETTLELPPGHYTVQARARDWEGNVETSLKVAFSVGAPQDGASAGAGAEDDDALDDRGCACSSGEREPAGVVASIGFVVLLASRRRRTRPVGSTNPFATPSAMPPTS